MLDLVVDAIGYRIVLPHAQTDYIQKKLVTEQVPYELEMLEDIRGRVSAGELVLDIGANIGNHTLFLAAVAGCEVHAFEPNPALCAALRQSIALNGLDGRVCLHETGLGRTRGRAHFGVSLPENLGGQHLSLGDGELHVAPLDDFAFVRPVAAIKLDVEGMEIDVLEGARQLLLRDRPLIYAECSTEQHYRRMARWMEAIGYTCWDSFNATPTHLFIASERLTIEQRLQHLQSRTAQTDYKSQQLLREVRNRNAHSREKEREANRLQLNKLTSELADSQTAARDLRQQLDQARRAEQRLERVVEVRDVRLAATQRRESELGARLQQIRESATFRIGQALATAARSPSAAILLPVQLLRIAAAARTRRRLREQEASQARGVSDVPGTTNRHDPLARELAPCLPAAGAEPARLNPNAKSLKGLRVAAIMDEFTHHSFAPECELMPLSIAGWQAQLEATPPDMVFIESAWRGAEGDWALKISNPSQELASLLQWAQDKRVPTVFWNKEDPVHFSVFLHVARAVDYVFTTDIDCIARYKREVGHERVYLLPFAAQPVVHNPIERFPRDDAFCFAGSYYLKYPERQRDFSSLLDAVKGLKPVEIFDRNFGNPHPHYEFPPQYQPFIVGTLPFDQIDKAYKGYRYGINMNTIKQSQTMFARRVFELLASNTVVVSNFSRGMRLFFGDLVISSDASSEVQRRLAPLADETTLRKFRLAGLRKVMAEHTYANRLAYVAGQLGGDALAATHVNLCVIAFADDEHQARHAWTAWSRQSLAGTTLCLVGRTPAQDAFGARVFHAPDVKALKHLSAFQAAEWIAPISPADYHGPNYLLDLHQATGYCDADAVGKAAHYRLRANVEEGVELIDGALAYRPVERLRLRACLLTRARFESLELADSAALDAAELRGAGLMAVDEFSFALDAGVEPDVAVRQAVDDLPGLRRGIDLAQDLLPRAGRIGAATQPDGAAGWADAPGLSAEELAGLMHNRVGARVDEGRLRISISLPAGKHHYIYLERVFERAALNLEMNSRIHLVCTHDDTLEVRTVFEFLDANKQKISHAINKAGQAGSLAIPAQCRNLRVGLRFVGHGELLIERLVLADLRERPTVFVGTSPNLVVLKQYPDYEDLYKYGFVHSRLRAYRREGQACDVFRLASEEPYACREFENVDIATGDRDLLDLALQSGQFAHVLVHLMDRSIWEVLRRHLDRVKATVWVHGAEIQVWQRREFEFERMDQAEVARQKKLSDRRANFWHEVLDQPHPNLRLVFVSRHFADETMADLSLDPQLVPHEIIHNYIDDDVFTYAPKRPEDRLALLSIRPFASRKYANDLTVAAILSVAREPWFGELRITIAGDGELFEELTQPLAGLPNVTLEKRFLTQAEIARLHRHHGVFLSPTRMDAQGVSRDEAMSSGLVPITNRVAAVPEFVDEDCGLLAPADDAEALAAAIRQLHDDPALFLRLSAAAARRVREQSGFERTIRREIQLFAG